jgi:hypothetical protein
VTCTQSAAAGWNGPQDGTFTNQLRMEEKDMYRILSAASAAVVLSLAGAPALAMPAGMQGTMVGTEQSTAQPVAYRRCWYEDGRRHCRRTVTRYYYDDDGYYGYGPGINLYFGGGGGRHGGHHGGHHR